MDIIHITNISKKYSPLYVLMSFQNYFGFFRTSTFRDIWRKIPRFISKIVCLFTLVPFQLYSEAWLVYWIECSHLAREDSGLNLLFLRSKKTAEYSEIYSEELTSEHLPLYNYRSSTLRGISRNIGRLLWQCSCRHGPVRLTTVCQNWDKRSVGNPDDAQ